MYQFKKLKKTYDNFNQPFAVIKVGGKNIATDKKGFAISDISVELTSGFEANVAEFCIYNAYNFIRHEFKFDDIKNYIFLGSPVEISMGYGMTAKDVFRGFISAVDFIYPDGGAPTVKVYAMDIKGIMMANSYAKKIKKDNYGDAIKELFDQPFYQKLKGSDMVYNELNIADTPDKPSGGQPTNEADNDNHLLKMETNVEMVNESDYEFVVRACKRFNYEFFQTDDTILIRKAKADTNVLVDLTPDMGIISFEIGYDITGIAGEIEVRNSDPAKGKVVNFKMKHKNKISYGNKAKPLLNGQKKIYVDPTASTQKEAEYRCRYLREQMDYRFGTLEVEMIGLPEIVPGKFITVKGMGKGTANKFYITSVTHEMDSQSIYKTHISGKAATLEQ